MLNQARWATAILAIATLSSAQTTHHRGTALEPSNSFTLLDRRLSLLSQQQLDLIEPESSSRFQILRQMARTVASIEHIALRMQSHYQRRHERFGVRIFHVLRVRANAVQDQIHALEIEHSVQSEQPRLKALDSRLLDLIAAFQATSGGYSALRCKPGQWTCCSPKRKEDLRPGQTMACLWNCTSSQRSCTGFLGPHLIAR